MDRAVDLRECPDPSDTGSSLRQSNMSKSYIRLSDEPRKSETRVLILIWLLTQTLSTNAWNVSVNIHLSSSMITNLQKSL